MICFNKNSTLGIVFVSVVVLMLLGNAVATIAKGKICNYFFSGSALRFTKL